MRAREREPRPEPAESLPLITESATVTRVRALDERRGAAVRAAVRDLLDVYDADESLAEGDLDWQAVRRALDCEERSVIGHVVDQLEERAERKFPSLLSVRFRTEEPIDFAPGEYVAIRYERVPRVYSVASSPNADYTELCIRRVPGGRLTSRLCDDVEPGDELTVRGPYGDFTLDESSDRDVAFLATGTGVAPLHSMANYLYEEGLAEGRDVWLFLGASWRDDLPYHGRFRALDEAHDNFHYVPTCSREELLTDWTGETAYVQQTLVEYLADDALDGVDLDGGLARYADRDPAYDVDARVDPANLEVYACGITAMVEALTGACRAVGVPADAVYSEGYG